MTKFKTGDTIYVPATVLSEPDNATFALVKRKVLSQQDRSVVVDDIGGRTVRIASSKAHSSELGFLALKIGDFATESTLLDPLAKSVLQWRDGVSAILTWTITNSWCIPPG